MFVGPFFVKALHGRNAVEVILTEGYDLKHPTFPVSLLKKYISAEGAENMPVPVPPPVLEDAIDPGAPSKILDEKLTRVHGQDCRLYLTRFKNKSPDEDQWLPKESIKNADVLLRKFRAKRRNPDTRIRAILFCGGKCQPPASPEGAELRHDTATGPDTTTGYRTESPGPAGTQTQPPPRSSARVSRRALNPLAY
ncbi:hypothetical protein Pst134EA_011342 [Puccinia striiformis f. sp. tritici]|nr:hypothetical protein Pst134EA_011342 [Puccinia striiformis f. sp. tritici]KAH9467710.1 hypothetical protein Pst134EA_011342 [Puccinia striiformis f. sp. tritici]